MWIVNVKGTFNNDPEISVVKEDNHHGINSYGWFDENKILVFGSGGHCRYTLSEIVFNKHIETAKYLADLLNTEF